MCFAVSYQFSTHFVLKLSGWHFLLTEPGKNLLWLSSILALWYSMWVLQFQLTQQELLREEKNVLFLNV